MTTVLAMVALVGGVTAQRENDTSASGRKHTVVCKASVLTGKAVMDAHGNEMGGVEGLLLDPGTGRVGYMIVRTRGDHAKSCALSIRKCHVKRRDANQIDVTVREKDLATAATVDQINDVHVWRAKKVVGMTVEDASGKRLGQIEALYVDPARRCACYAAIGMGRALGIGEKRHIVPYSALHVRPDRNKAVVVLSRDALKKAPAYARDDAPPMDDLAWHIRMHRIYSVPVYWELGQRMLRASKLEGASVRVWGREAAGEVKGVLLAPNGADVFLAVSGKTHPGQVSAVPLEEVYLFREGDERKFGVAARVLAEAVHVPEADWERQLAARGVNPDGTGALALRPAGEILGRRVMNAVEQRIGDVEDLLLDPTRGRIGYAVMGVGDFLGIGRVLHVVPWTSLKAAGDKAYRLDVTQSDLRVAPKFKPEEWGRIDGRWLDRIDAFYRAIFTKP